MMRRLEASADIQAPPQAVYGLLADYREGHPRILPPRYFSNLVVERGGVGAGTVFRCDLTLLGTRRTFRAEVSEPEPGRVLAERMVENGMLTTFEVTPQEGDRACRLTIATALPAQAGARARLEFMLVAPFLRRAYAAELRLVARTVEAPPDASGR